VGSFGLVAAEGAGVGAHLLAVETAPAQVLTHRPLGDPDAVTREQDVGDVSGTARGVFQAQGDRLLDELRVAAHDARVPAGLALEALEALRPVPAQPAVQAGPADHPRAAVRALVHARGHLAHQLAPLPGRQARVRRLRDQGVPAEGEDFGGIQAHELLLCDGLTETGGIKAAPPSPAQGGLALVPSNSPPLTRLANSKRPTTRSPSRRRACVQAIASASSPARPTAPSPTRIDPPPTPRTHPPVSAPGPGIASATPALSRAARPARSPPASPPGRWSWPPVRPRSRSPGPAAAPTGTTAALS